MSCCTIRLSTSPLFCASLSAPAPAALCAIQSYANIAGVPAVMGLYGAFLPVLVYALFGSSRQLGVGPVAVTSGLIFSGLKGLIPGYDKITNPNDPTPEQLPIMVRMKSGCNAVHVTYAMMTGM